MLAVGGNGTLVRSLDGAAPVKLNGLVSQMSTDQLNDIWFHDRNWVLAAGNQGLYSRDSTGAWSKVLVPGLGSFPRFNAVTGLLTDDGAMEVWAAGGFGGVVRLANSSGSYTTDSQTGTFIIPFGGLDSQFKNATINRMTGYSKKAGGKTIETHYVLAGEVKNPDGTSTLGSFWTIRSLNPAKPGPAIPTP
ncbi:MAG: hypothetical protein GMKNLPBB_02016 [Myxococcota bacterium]|nr:hypothetical protein [Myxococcota bacterium]